MIFWIIYTLFSLILSYLFMKIFDNFYIKLIVYILSLALFMSVWFISPGNSEMAPVLSIFLMELFFVESNGFERLLRSFLLFFGTSSLLSLIIIFLKFKN